MNPEYDTPDSCPHCGSTNEPYWSRIVPMGYICPDCGKDLDPVMLDDPYTQPVSPQ